MLERMRIKIVGTTLQMQLQLRCVHRKRAISQLFLFNQGYGLGNSSIPVIVTRWPIEFIGILSGKTQVYTHDISFYSLTASIKITSSSVP